MITINLDKAKAIGHGIRRSQRAAEFVPLDAQININIADPARLAEIEAQRQEVRDKYAQVQTEIDAAATPGEIKAALGIEG